MHWSRSWIRGVAHAIAAAGVGCVLAGPDVVWERLGSLFAATRNVAERAMVDHDLAALARRLDTTRDALRQAESLRAELVQRLSTLEIRRQAARPRVEQAEKLVRRIAELIDRLPEGSERRDLDWEASRQRQRSHEIRCEVTELDGAIGAIGDEVLRADRRIQECRDRLQASESELAILQAAKNARRLSQELSALNDPRRDESLSAQRVSERLSLPEPGHPVRLDSTD